MQLGLKSTPFIKLKMDSNVQTCEQNLEIVAQEMSASERGLAGVQIVIDANASWTSGTTLHWLSLIKDAKERAAEPASLPPFERALMRVVALEQPFPVDFGGADDSDTECE